MKKVSIIIPVYNGVDYLERCYESVIAQAGIDLNDIELITINDGSSDDSLRIMREYERKYPYLFKVIDQQNAGIAMTRNTAITQAIGEYLMFMDQDDWIDNDYIQTFYNEIERTGADVVSGGYRRPDATGQIKQISIPNNTEYGKYIIVAAWAKIHRTQFIRENDIKFFQNKFGEDSVFTAEEISLARRWHAIPYVGYNWYVNQSSTSNTAQKGLSGEDNSYLVRLLDRVNKTKKGDVNSNIDYYLLRTAVFYLLFSGRKAPMSRFMDSYTILFTWLQENAMNFPQRADYIFGIKGEVLKVRVIIGVFVVLHRLGLVSLLARVIATR